MNKNVDDNKPSDVPPHAGLSWREKYEYMNTLWLKQKDENATLQNEKQRREGEMQSLLHLEVAKKNTEIARLEEDKYRLYTEVARLDAEVSRLRAEVATLMESTDTSQIVLEDTSATAKVEDKTKTKAEAEEIVVKNTKTASFICKYWATYFTLLLINILLVLIMYKVSKKISLPLVAIGENTLLMLSSP